MSLILFATVYGFFAGIFEEVNRLDITKISFGILGLFYAMSFYCGTLTWRFDNVIENPGLSCQERSRLLIRLENKAEHGWFILEICEKLGLLGTVFGILILLAGGFVIQSGDQQALKVIMERLSIGMSTALITTAVGIIATIILSVQYHVLSNSIDAARARLADEEA